MEFKFENEIVKCFFKEYRYLKKDIQKLNKSVQENDSVEDEAALIEQIEGLKSIISKLEESGLSTIDLILLELGVESYGSRT